MRQHMTADANKVDDSTLFNRANWTALTAAIDMVTSSNTGGTVKYGLKNSIFYPLMSSADLLEGVALTSITLDEVVTEMVNFKKVLKHHENSIFSDAKYLINKSRQERLRLPTCNLHKRRWKGYEPSRWHPSARDVRWALTIGVICPC